MKILHTSDWHLGQKLYNYDRREEHLRFLDQIAVVVRAHRPDAMVVSGDLFHSYNPPVETQKMLVDAIVKIHENNPAMTIVLTAGNHDSYSRIEVDRQLWKKFNVHVIGNIARKEDNTADYDKHIIEVSPGGRLVGYIVAVPYSFEQNFPVIPEYEPARGSMSQQNYYFQNILKEVDARNAAGLPVVLMAHTTIAGCDVTGHEGDVTGGVEATKIADMGTGYDYMALGHIHHAQFVNGNIRVRYSGTPLPVGFGEQSRHSVTIVEIDAHGEMPICREIAMDTPMPLVTIPPKGALPLREALERLEKFNSTKSVYIRLNVSMKPGEYVPPETRERINAIMAYKWARFCHINRVEKAGRAAGDDKAVLYDIAELQRLSTGSIVDIVRQRVSLDDKEAAMLEAVIEELKNRQEL